MGRHYMDYLLQTRQRYVSYSSISPTRTLANLPPDVIRIIVRTYAETGTEPVEKLRLISRTWNEIVLEYLANRRNHPTIETVQFWSGAPLSPNSINESGTFTVRLELRNPMHSDRLRRVCRGWKESPCSFNSPRMQVPAINILKNTCSTVACFLFCVYPILSYLFGLSVGFVFESLPWLITHIVLLLIAVFVCVILSVVHYVEERREIRRLVPIFKRCCAINSLYLINSNQFVDCKPWPNNFRQALNSFRKTLGDISVENILVCNKDCDHKMRRTLLEMVRQHKISTLILCIEKWDKKGMHKFFRDITQTASTLLIYERSDKAVKIFEKPIEYWEDDSKLLRDESFSFELMDGELFQFNDRNHLLRFKIGKRYCV